MTWTDTTARLPLAPLERRSSAACSARRPDALTVAAALVLATQPTGDAPMRSVPVVTDKPATEVTTHIVIEGALP